MARVLEANSRSHDVVARYGGEEFSVILPETDPPGALHYAEKMREAVEAAPIFPNGDGVLTISVGVASTGADVRSPQDLVVRADERLYRAKQAGRNRVCAGDS